MSKSIRINKSAKRNAKVVRLFLFGKPIARAKEIPDSGLAATPLRFIVIYPPDKRRQRHQYRFRAPARFEPEMGPAIIDQVEFDIAAATYELEFALAFRIRFILAQLGYRQICRKKGAAKLANEIKNK